MTRMLSHILEAEEPRFQTRLRALERANGGKNADIALSVEVLHAVQDKITRLGLDKHDTTPRELYRALQARVKADDARLERVLRTRAAHQVSAEALLEDGLHIVLGDDARQIPTFAIKSVVLKRLLKAVPPKRVQKQLGYRSLDAMLRNEQAAALVAVARHLESVSWQKAWNEQYKKLDATQFEDRSVQVISLVSDRWRPLAASLRQAVRKTSFGVPEVGALVVLPLGDNKPAGMVVATLAHALHDLNVIAGYASYLKASQVQPDFGVRVVSVAHRAVELDAEGAVHEKLSWHVVQQYFAHAKEVMSADIFGPYVEAIDFYWHNVEQRIAAICPSMEFWHGSHYLSFVHEGQSVSCNVLDVAVSACNDLTYEIRSQVHAKAALWHELTLRYINKENLELTLTRGLQPQLAHEFAPNK